MKRLRVKITVGALVSFENSEGRRCVIPLMWLDGKWQSVGGYLKLGLSKSDRSWGALYALPYQWEPPRRMLLAVQAKRKLWKGE